MGVHVFPILNPPSHLPPHPIPQGHPSAPALSTLSHASILDWRSVSHMVPTRLLCPWDSPGKNTGVGCHFLLQCLKVKSESEVSQSCLTLSDPHGLQPTRLLYPWEFSGESTGVGRQCLLQRKRAIGGKGIKFSLEPSLHVAFQ